MAQSVYLSSYSPVGDLTVVSICLVMFVLMIFSYINKSRSFNIFVSTVVLVMFAAVMNVSFHTMAEMGSASSLLLVRAYRIGSHACLFLVLQMFVIYIGEVTRLERGKKRLFATIGGVICLTVIGMDTVNILSDASVVTTEQGIVFRGHGVFIYGYLVLVALLVAELFYVRKRLYRRVMMGFYGSIVISFGILLRSGLQRQTSFTVATFLYPIIAMFYIMHSNPYDAMLGAVDSRGLQEYVKYNYEHKRDFMFMSLYMRDLDEEGKHLPEGVEATVRRFASEFFRGATLFQVSAGHVILVFSLRRNPDYEQRINRILVAFRGEYLRFHYDYKIVIGKSISEVSRRNEYVSFIRDIHRSMDENTVRRIGQEDVNRFNSNEYVLHELADIYAKRDLNDPRVLAYCQPVYNLKTGRYDTAEALMRLTLEKQGMVFPDQFIPLAEENGYIHVLTEIILNKVCQAVHKLTETGYHVGRVSVNVSALELRDEKFCYDITRIIDRNSIEGDKIAIELTESKTDTDFMLMKNKISELREKGIKFYLDDFGTGYSNMERIMELPFDIIKFDKSMIAACGLNERSHRIVVSLAAMLAEMNYAVLFEGVEKDSDEALCVNMSASYLQGYKYSKPVPIDRLQFYFDQKAS